MTNVFIFMGHARAVGCAVVLLFFAVNAGFSAGRPGEPLRLLTIGNSFAQDATAFLPQLAAAANRSLVLFGANIGGATMERHVRHMEAFERDPTDPEGRPYHVRVHPKTGQRGKLSLREALEAEAWDVVTIQQASPMSFKPESYHPYARQLIEYVRAHAPEAEIVVHQTWVYREDHPWFAEGTVTPARMYAGLRAAYYALAAEWQLRIIPVGEAFERARQHPFWRFQYPDPGFDYQNPPADRLPRQAGSLNVGWRWRKHPETGKMDFGLDAIHANTAGRFLGAAAFFEVLWGESVLENPWKPGELTPEQAQSLREAAHAAVLGLPEVFKKIKVTTP